jgi:adenylyl-sulfate kinase
MRHEGFTLWFTGLSGAGKTSLAEALLEQLHSAGAKAELLDGDIVRRHLSAGLGFSREDRDANIRRIGFVSQLLARNGVIAIVAAISPYRATRNEVRRDSSAFVEVFVDCSMEVLVQRDPKGLYRRALAGEIEHFTGVSDPYEEPEHPEIVLHTDRESLPESAGRIWAELERRGLISPA